MDAQDQDPNHLRAADESEEQADSSAESTPEDPAAHLTPEQHRGPTTVQVALLLLMLVLVVGVWSNPRSVLPKGTTLLGDRHDDRAAGLSIPIPVGWRVVEPAEYGSSELVPVESTARPDVMIFAGRLDAGLASSFPGNRGASAAMAGQVQQHVLAATGVRDDVRDAAVSNDLGDGRSTSYVLAPTNGRASSAGLVYAAVFGTPESRWWLAYVSRVPSKSPDAGWVDKIVHGIRAVE